MAKRTRGTPPTDGAPAEQCLEVDPHCGKPVEEKELGLPDEQADTGHDGVAEAGAEGNHQNGDAHARGLSGEPLVGLGEEEVDKAADNANNNDEVVYEAHRAHARQWHDGALDLAQAVRLKCADQAEAGPGAHYHRQGHPGKTRYLWNQTGQHEHPEDAGDYHEVVGRAVACAGELVPEVGLQYVEDVVDDPVAGTHAHEEVFCELVEGVVTVKEAVEHQGEHGAQPYPDYLPVHFGAPFLRLWTAR